MSPLEHPSMHKPMVRAADTGGLHLTVLDARPTGLSPLSPARAADVAAADVLVCTSAHNETGHLPPLDDLIAAARDEVIVVTDAAQSLARVGPPHPRADVVVASAHKIGGYSGAGCLALRNHGRALPAPWAGSGQEHGVRPGTEAKELIAAFGAACAVIDRTRAENQALSEIRDALERAVVAAAPAANVIGGADRLAQTTAISLHDIDGEALRMALDLAGLDVGFGSACSALAPEPSRALLAMGIDAAVARSTVRLSLAPGFTAAGGAEAASRISDVIKRLAAR